MIILKELREFTDYRKRDSQENVDLIKKYDRSMMVEYILCQMDSVLRSGTVQ